MIHHLDFDDWRACNKLCEELDVVKIVKTSNLLMAEAFIEYSPLTLMSDADVRIIECEWFVSKPRKRAAYRSGIKVGYLIVLDGWARRYPPTLEKCSLCWRDFLDGWARCLDVNRQP